MNLVWSAKFTRTVKRLVGRDKKLLSEIEQTLTQLAADPKHPTLRSHKLKGDLAGTWACSVDYSRRIIFDFTKNPATGELEIVLLAVGTHDEVY